MELTEYWRVLRHRWRVILVCALAGLLVASIATMLMPRRYEATAELFVAPEVGTTSSELQEGSRFLLDRVKSYVEVVAKSVVLEPVIEELGLSTSVGDLSERVTAEVIPETVVVTITVEDESPEAAARIANAVADQFVDAAPTLEPMRADETPVVAISVIDPARVPESPASPQAQLNLLLGLVAGLAAGLAAAVAREALDNRVKSGRDVKQLTEAPLMGYISLDPRADKAPVMSAGARSIRAEATRQLRTNLQFIDVSSGRRSYVITSSLRGEGKTVTAINLAITLAEAGHRVCLLEADLRRPRAGRYLGLEGSAGLTDALIDRAAWADLVQQHMARLDVLLAGTIPPNPSDLLASEAMDKLLSELEAAYDVVIIDAPPLLPVADAAVLSMRCAGAIVMVAFGRNAVTRNELSHSLEMLEKVGARVLGIVLNKVPQKGPNAVSNSASYEEYGGQSVGKHSKRRFSQDSD